MAEPVLTQYLLKLATDEAELDRFRKIQTDKAEIVDYLMAEHRLSQHQAEVLHRNDPRKISEAVVEELSALSSTGKPLYGTALAISVPLGNFQQGGHHVHLTE